MHRLRLAAVLLSLLLVAAGCGKSNKVGDESLLNFKDQTNERLGQSTTTASTASTTTSTTTAGNGKAGVGGPSTTASTVKATTTTVQQVALEIFINPDEGESQFDPPTGRILQNSNVKFTNKDAKPRAVKGDKNEFLSPMLAPGESWVWKATVAGRINYHDETRPYAVGSFEVVKR